MKKHIFYKYEAFDGTMFEDALECRAYEMREKSIALSLVLLDEEWKELPINSDGMERCYTIICNSSEDIEFVKENFGAEGYTHPFNQDYGTCEEKVGIYFYDEGHAMWVNFDERFEGIKEKYELCLSYRK